MTPEQLKALMDAAAATGDRVNAWNSAALIFLGFFMGAVVVIISLSLVFVVVRLLAVQTLFINKMTERSVMANEQIRLSTDTQTQAITGQTNALTAMNQTGLSTGAAVEKVDGKITLVLTLAKELGVDVKDIAKHAVAPTAATQEKVEKIADKPAETVAPVAPASEKPVAEAAPATVEVALPVTLVAAAEVPAG